jgi:hypothetical protein
MPLFNKTFKIAILAFFCSQSLATTGQKTILLQDKLVFKLAQEVFTVHDLKKYFKGMEQLKCIYADSLLLQVFSKQFNQKHQSKYSVEKEYSESKKKYFKELLKFGKILVYSRSYDVHVAPEIQNTFYLSANTLGCGTMMFDAQKKFLPYFSELVRLEIFVRSRSLSGKKFRTVSKDELTKAISSVQSILKSIDNQIDQVLYW